jgi:RNA polymerase-binding transcription factor DksA
MTTGRKQLEAELQETEEELEELNRRLDDKPEFGLGEGSSGAYTWEMTLARKERVKARIEALQEALAKVHEGSYGRCERCDAKIDPERLEILPATTLCVDCAQAAGAATSYTANSAPGALVQG